MKRAYLMTDRRCGTCVL